MIKMIAHPGLPTRVFFDYISLFNFQFSSFRSGSMHSLDCIKNHSDSLLSMLQRRTGQKRCGEYSRVLRRKSEKSPTRLILHSAAPQRYSLSQLKLCTRFSTRRSLVSVLRQITVLFHICCSTYVPYVHIPYAPSGPVHFCKGTFCYCMNIIRGYNITNLAWKSFTIWWFY